MSKPRVKHTFTCIVELPDEVEASYLSQLLDHALYLVARGYRTGEIEVAKQPEIHLHYEITEKFNEH